MMEGRRVLQRLRKGEEIRQRIAPNRMSDPWKRWKNEFKRAVREAFAKEGKVPPGELNDIVKASHGSGFELTLVALVQ